MFISIKIGKLMITERTILKTVYILSCSYLAKASIGACIDNKRIESDKETALKKIESDRETALKKIDADKEVALKGIEAGILWHQSK